MELFALMLYMVEMDLDTDSYLHNIQNNTHIFVFISCFYEIKTLSLLCQKR